MPSPLDRILIVESDPVISDMIGRQALQSAGYQVMVVSDVSAAINKAVRWAPDLIIASLSLPGLSVKDLLVALSSQGLNTPIIILAPRGTEASLIPTFRLGAADYLLWPARETEILAAVERVLQQVHDRKERESLSQKLQQTNVELQQRVRELTTIFSIGKAVIPLTDPATLYEKIVDGAVKVSQADFGWFLLREERGEQFRLVAHRNLPPALSQQLNQVWDDGISSLAVVSGEPLNLHGETMKRFKISAYGQSILVVPVKVQKQVIALIVMMRKQSQPFSESDQNVLQTAGYYASISLVNARLFQAVEERASQQQQAAEQARAGEKMAVELLQKTRKEVQQPFAAAADSLKKLTRDSAGWTVGQRERFTRLSEQVQVLQRFGDSFPPLTPADHSLAACSLNELTLQASQSFQPLLQQYGLALALEIPPQPVLVLADENIVAAVLYGLLSNAVKFCDPSSRITLCVEQSKDGFGHVMLESPCSSADEQMVERAFTSHSAGKTPPQRFGGPGISLKLMKEILSKQNGKIWIDVRAGQSVRVHFSLPLSQ